MCVCGGGWRWGWGWLGANPLSAPGLKYELQIKMISNQFNIDSVVCLSLLYSHLFTYKDASVEDEHHYLKKTGATHLGFLMIHCYKKK